MTAPHELPRATLQAWDDAHLWHPFTPHSVYRSEDPPMIVAAEGHELIDADGRRYLDAIGTIWCNLFGHQAPDLDRAITDQLGRVAHSTLLGAASAPAVVLARRLAERAPPGLTRVFFSDDGSTAVEAALKLALQFHQQTGAPERTRFLSLDGAYHGDTVGAVSIGHIGLFHGRYRPLLFESLAAPSPYCYRCPLGLARPSCQTACADELVRIARENAGQLAAIVLEPGFQGAAGVLPLPDGFLRAARAVCDETGALLVLDEVATGFGRTGTLFACEQEGVSPDLLCVAKGLTGGYLPMAATLATERLFEAFLGRPSEGRTFFHGHTYTGNALAAAVGLAVLDRFDDPALLARVRAASEVLARALDGLRALPWLGDIRQVGLAAGVELVADPETRQPFDPARRVGQAVCVRARHYGVFLRPLGDTVVMMPPLTFSDAELERTVLAVRAAAVDVLG